MNAMWKKQLAQLLAIAVLGACTVPTLTVSDGSTADVGADRTVDALVMSDAPDGMDGGDAGDGVMAPDVVSDTGCPDSACGCADLHLDPANCGQCAHACPTAPNMTPFCAAGVCDARCVGTHGDCDRNAGNGCEVDLAGATADCGLCGRSCGGTGPANTVPACLSGVCGFACAPGSSDCDHDMTNGCEPLNTASNCGRCNASCSGVPNGVPVCTAGRCSFVCASPEFGDCDGLASNGCELFLFWDPRNCGACGRICTGGARCCIGACLTFPAC